MTVESFRLRVKDNFFVFATANSTQRLEEISEILRRAGARHIGSGAWSFDTETMATPQAITALFDRLEDGENVYILSMKDGVLHCSILAEAKTTGGITVAAEPRG